MTLTLKRTRSQTLLCLQVLQKLKTAPASDLKQSMRLLHNIKQLAPIQANLLDYRKLHISKYPQELLKEDKELLEKANEEFKEYQKEEVEVKLDQFELTSWMQSILTTGDLEAIEEIVDFTAMWIEKEPLPAPIAEIINPEEK